jgi:subtilisin family serine protease
MPCKNIFSLSALALAASLAAVAHAQSNNAPQRYIVRLHDNTPAVAVDSKDPRIHDRMGFEKFKPNTIGHIQRLEKTYGFKARHVFGHGVQGFAAELTQAQLARLKADKTVALVEPDVKIKALTQLVPYGIINVGATVSPAVMAGDREDNAVPELTNVRVVVMDSGVAPQPELNLIQSLNYTGDGISGDCNGHGTHVAGTIGARDNDSGVVGVAPGVPLVDMKVLGCDGSGYVSSVVQALDQVGRAARENLNVKYVVNASLGLPDSVVLSTLDSAIQNAVASGVTVVVAAGNNGVNACSTSMARLSSRVEPTGVMAVAAVDDRGREASWSNYGSCIAMWAPGVGVASLSPIGSIASLSGTSMAAPHVAGAAAAVRAVYPSWSAVQVDEYLKKTSRALSTRSKDGSLISHLDISTLAKQNILGPIEPPTPQASAVTLIAGNADFGLVRRGSASPNKTLTLSNSGMAPLTLTGMAGLPAAVKVVGNTCQSIAPGADCTLTLALSTASRTKFRVFAETTGADKNLTIRVSGEVR